MKTNFDQFLEEQLSDPTLADKFKRANETWDIVLQGAKETLPVPLASSASPIRV